jgi:hypothetical protein
MAALSAGNTLNGVTLGTNIINFPANQPGNYKVDINLYAGTSVTAPTAGGGVGSVGATAGPKLYATGGVIDNATAVYSAASTVASYAMISQTVTIGNAGGVLTFTPSTIVGGEGVDIFITALPSTVLTVDEQEQLEIDQIKQSYSRLQDRIGRLEYLLTRPASPAGEEKQSETPTDMETSIHVDQDVLKQLRKALAK